MRTIQLTQGKETLVDDVDYELLTEFKFFYNGGYARTYVDGQMWFLHHVLIGKPTLGLVVDHINRNTLDNRRENLRVVTKGVNQRNNDALGVRHRKGAWEMRITINRKTITEYLPTFEEAISRRQELKELHDKS